jgi:hypothetical protein
MQATARAPASPLFSKQLAQPHSISRRSLVCALGRPRSNSRSPRRTCFDPSFETCASIWCEHPPFHKGRARGPDCQGPRLALLCRANTTPFGFQPNIGPASKAFARTRALVGAAEMVSKSGVKIDTTGWSLSLRYNGSCRPVVAQSKEFRAQGAHFRHGIA